MTIEDFKSLLDVGEDELVWVRHKRMLFDIHIVVHDTYIEYHFIDDEDNNPETLRPYNTFRIDLDLDDNTLHVIDRSFNQENYRNFTIEDLKIVRRNK